MRQSHHLAHDRPRPGRRRQYFATISAAIGGLSVGTVIGYASPATYQLREDDNATESANSTKLAFCDGENISVMNYINCLQEYISSYTTELMLPYDNRSFVPYNNQSILSYDDQSINLHNNQSMVAYDSQSSTKMLPAESVSLNSSQLSWFSSSFSIGALIGGILAGVLIRHAGRRGGMMVSVLPSLAGWLFIGLGRSFWPLVVGRTLTGVYTGLACVSVNTYIGEIASSDIRGMLGTSFQFALGTGIVYAYTFGAFTDWDVLAFICCAPPIISGSLVFLNPESPAFLVLKGKKDEGRAALQKLRGSSWDVSEEMEALEQRAEEALAKKATLKDLLLTPNLLRPLVIVLGVMVFQQLCGINALVFNLDTIFKSAGSNMSASVSSILVSLVQTLATLLAYFFVETAGRKLLLIISSVFMAVGHGLVGLFFYMLETEEEWTQQHLEWLPLFGVVVFQLAFSVGYGAIPWVMMGEMFPSSVREMASSLATVTNWTVSFFVIYSFEPLQAALPTYWFYWLFACFCVLAAIFSATVVVETKGKTFEEINAMFS